VDRRARTYESEGQNTVPDNAKLANVVNGIVKQNQSTVRRAADQQRAAGYERQSKTGVIISRQFKIQGD
jgi:hypothetical protein